MTKYSMLKNSAFAFLFFVLVIKSYSQANNNGNLPVDYVVIADTAQKSGVARFNPKTQELEFRLKFSSIFNRYSINDVTEFSFQRSIYFRKTTPQGFVFVKRLVEGEVNLYEASDGYHIETDEQYIANEENYLEIFNTIYSEKCNWDFNKPNLKYKEATLSRLVAGYNKNECYKLPKEKLSFELGVGKLHSQIGIKANPHLISNIESEHVNVQVGLVKEIAIDSKKSFIINGFFTHQKFTPGIIKINQRSFDFERSANFIGINGMVRFYFGPLYVSAGVGPVFTVSNKTTFKPNSTSDIDGLDIPSLNPGYKLCLGYKILERKSSSIKIELQNFGWGGGGSKVVSNQITFLVNN